MPRPTPLPESLGPSFSAGDALHAGASRRRLRARDLDAPFYGVRVVGGPPASLEERCRAYLPVMAATHVFSHATAALLHGIPVPRRAESSAALHVTALRGGRAPRGNGIAGHRTTATVGVRILRGIPLLAPAETWSSLATVLHHDELIAAGDRLIGLPHPLATMQEMREAISRLGRRGGVRALRSALDEVRPGSHSPKETATRLVLARARLPEPELNAAVSLRSGRVTRGDLVFRPWQVLVEYDGEQHATDLAQWRIDVDRLNDFVEDGWRVIRVTKQTAPSELVARTERALRERGWRP